MEHIEERLSQLKEEQEELGRYEELDRRKRALEFAYYTEELEEIIREIAHLNEHECTSERVNEARTEAIELEERLKGKDKQMRAVLDKVQNYSEELELVSEEKKRLREATTKLGLSVNEGKENLKSLNDQETELRNRLNGVTKEIEEAKEQITELKPRYLALVEAERKAKEDRESCEYRRQALYNKQGQTKQFSSKKDRDRWIRKEMSEVQESLKEKEREIEELRKENIQLKEKIESLGNLQDKFADQLSQKQEFLEKARASLKSKESKRHEYANRRTVLWKKESDLVEKLESASDQLSDAERKLQGCTKRTIRDGIHLVMSYARRKKIGGVYGPLIELFECSQELYSAVEVAGRLNLFHVVVDTDETASILLRVLNKERVGRVTFIPLNQLNPKVTRVIKTGEVISLVSELKYDPLFEKAIQQVFGRFLVCPNLDIACSYAGTDGLSCVTLEGDLVDRKGSMSGGYEERAFSSLEFMSKTKRLRSEVDETRGELDKVRLSVQEADQSFTRVFGEIQKEQTRLAQTQNSISHVLLQQRSTNNEKIMLEKHAEEKEFLLSSVSSSLSRFQQMNDSLRIELEAPFSSTLSPNEVSEMKSIDREIEKLVVEEAKKSEKRAKVEEKKQNLENTIFSKLALQEDRLRKELASISNTESREYLTLENQLRDTNASLRDAEERAENIEKELQEGKKLAVTLEKEVDAMRLEYESRMKRVQQDSKSRERLLGRRNLLNKRRNERVKLIGELGPLPSNQEFQGRDVHELRNLLQETNTELGGLSKVNKKAGDQFRTFQEQRAELLKRKETLDKGAKKIQELVSTLDDKKAEAIQRTFRDVAYNFKKVFSELVPNGCGEMIMKTEEVSIPRSGSSSSSSSSPSSEESVGVIRQYVGVGVKVSFISRTLTGPDSMPLHQLSGGQKSLVALALIFAIQRCDPAPFYILDEIDAALDPGHRKAVAKMIAKQAQGEDDSGEKGTQFIYASFGEELVQNAEKHYRVTLEKNRSRLEQVKVEDALTTLRENQLERQAKK